MTLDERLHKLALIMYDWSADRLGKNRRYIVTGLQPFDFWWLTDELPYVIDRPVCYKNGAWCDEGLTGYARPQLRIVDLDRHTVTLLLKYGRDYAAFTFLRRRGEDRHPHPNGGAHWVTMDWSVLE